ncbi:DUF397 domain-containing protein [Streptomyces sp. NPDC048281]|uniref:DUF397 domain-containing protein n=1 Tax=Streptomyces sp. NPDC048281 TaxID=3154715 RepID=UPI00343F8125
MPPFAGEVNEEARWFKSSYSGGNATECLEASFSRAEVLIRDSKRPTGPHLRIAAETWGRFVADVEV